MSQVTYEQFAQIAKEFRIREERINLVGILGENEELINSKTGVLNLQNNEPEEAWWRAINAVAYPVEKVLGFWQKDNQPIPAAGLSSQGRKKEYSFIVTDRNRVGDYDAIACVTGIYQSPLLYDLYLDLHESLNRTGKKIRPIDLFVTQNGGAQVLTLQVDGLTNIQGLPDAAEMRLVVETSVDGTTSHNLNVLVHNKEGDISSTVYGNGFVHLSRHTLNNYVSGKMDFTEALEGLVDGWNEKIIPTMIFMNDQTFDKGLALRLIERMSEECKFSKNAAAKVRELYESKNLRTNAIHDSLYRVNMAFSQYFSDELDEKRELQNRRRTDYQKAIHRELKRRNFK